MIERRNIRDYVDFYDEEDPQRYGRDRLSKIGAHIRQVVKEHFPQGQPVIVELGCGKGALKDIFTNYVGIDISLYALREYVKGRRTIQADMGQLPIKTSSVGFVFSVAAIEHIPDPEKVFEEIDRALKKGGIAYLAPAWFCKPWAARGLPVKKYSELNLWDRIQKFLILIRDHIIYQGLVTIPKRAIREIEYSIFRQPLAFRYQKLKPNLEEYLCADSDAFSSMDPHMAILYYYSRGYSVFCSNVLSRIFYTHKPVMIRKHD